MAIVVWSRHMIMCSDNVLMVTNALRSVCFIGHPCAAIRSVQDIHLCDGGNINSYVWLNSSMNVP